MNSKTRPPHRWIRDPKKEIYWLKQMTLWQESGLSVRSFCKDYGVVETSFYAWRRELIIRARESNPGEANVAVLTPNKLRDARGREIAIRFRQTGSEDLQSTFTQEKPGRPSMPINEQNGVTIITPSGYQILVTQQSSFDLLESVLRLLQNLSEMAPLITVATSKNES